MDLVGKFRVLLTVEEHIRRGGLYSGVAGALAGERVRPVVLGFVIPEPAGKISLAGDRDALLATAGLTASSVACASHLSRGLVAIPMLGVELERELSMERS